jgi:hypothetical protein
MVPLIVLVIATLLLRTIGAAGVDLLNSWTWCLRGGLALMFLFTASAHWGKRSGDLIAMVPRVFPRPDLMVSATGVLEINGGGGTPDPGDCTRRRRVPGDTVDRAFSRKHTRRPRTSDDWR